MKFNVNKCKVMHYGINNPSYEYLINDEVLIDTEEERDLGVLLVSSIYILVNLLYKKNHYLYHDIQTQLHLVI